MKLKTTRRRLGVRMERKTVLTMGSAALGLFIAGFCLAHFQSSIFKIVRVGFYGAAAVAAVYFGWKFLRGLIWKTEKSLFFRSVKDYDPEGKAKMSVRERSPVKNS